MKTIISGGTGLIGSKLARNLAWEGHDVVVLSRNPASAPSFPEEVQVVEWDAKTPTGWGSIVNQADAIINLAGESIAGNGFFPRPWTPERKMSILSSRINAGEAIVQAIQDAHRKPSILIQASAIGYYGPLDDTIVNEHNPAGSDYLARTCLEWENSTLAVEELGVRRVITRLGIVLTMKGGAFPRLMLPFRFFAGGPIGTGNQYYSWIDIEDVCDAFRYLVSHEEARGIYNLTAPHPVTNRDFSRILGKVMGRPSFFRIPRFAFEFMFGEVATVVVDGQRVLPERLNSLGFTFQFPKLEMAVRDLLNRP
jgi:uncharacterized protein (TIGR01777 family)